MGEGVQEWLLCGLPTLLNKYYRAFFALSHPSLIYSLIENLFPYNNGWRPCPEWRGADSHEPVVHVVKRVGVDGNFTSGVPPYSVCRLIQPLGHTNWLHFLVYCPSNERLLRFTD